MQMFIQKRKVELGAGMVMGKHGGRSTKRQGFFWNEEIHTGILYPIDFFLNRHRERFCKAIYTVTGLGLLLPDKKNRNS